MYEKVEKEDNSEVFEHTWPAKVAFIPDLSPK